jgi:hypothetical protein
MRSHVALPAKTLATKHDHSRIAARVLNAHSLGAEDMYVMRRN